MTQAKHTPGPWTVQGHQSDETGQKSYVITSNEVPFIARVAEAGDAALIAAAPELLDANIQLVEQVKQLLDQIEKVQRGEWKPTSFCTSAARAIAADARETIAKAGGAA